MPQATETALGNPRSATKMSLVSSQGAARLQVVLSMPPASVYHTYTISQEQTMSARPSPLVRPGTLIAAGAFIVLAAAVTFGSHHLDRLWDSLDPGQSGTEPDPSAETPAVIHWVGCDICKAAFMDAAAEAFEKKTGHRILVEDGGASRGIIDVSTGKAHLGGTCRQCCLDRDDEQDVKLVPVAWDCLVVAVHKSNPIENITRDELRAIYSGKLTRWEDLTGGRHRGTIQALARKGKRSGVGFSTRQLLFQDIDYDYKAPALDSSFPSTRLLEDALEQRPAAIGVTGYTSARLRLAPSGSLKMLQLEGKAPTRENVAAGAYLFYRPLYLSVPLQIHPAARAFLAFLYSQEGQAIIRGTGTITLEEGKGLWEKYKEQMQQPARKGVN
jgi:phosphate transport system substrate-binding protein